MAGAKRYLSRLAVTVQDDGNSAIQLISPVRLVVSAPANVSGSSHVYGKTTAGRTLLHVRAGAGREFPVAAAFRNRHTGFWNWFNGQHNVSGLSGLATTGSAYNHQPGATGITGSLSATASWLGTYSATSAGSNASLVLNGQQFVPGDGNGRDGFMLSIRGGVVMQTPKATCRAFIGVSVAYTTGTANPEPSTLSNVVGAAVLSTDAAQWYIVFGGTAAQSPIATGVPVYAGSSYSWENGQLVDLHIYADPNNAATYYVRLETADGTYSFETTISGGPAVVPQASSSLYALGWVNNNTYAAGFMIFWSKLYYSKGA